MSILMVGAKIESTDNFRITSYCLHGDQCLGVDDFDNEDRYHYLAEGHKKIDLEEGTAIVVAYSYLTGDLETVVWDDQYWGYRIARPLSCSVSEEFKEFGPWTHLIVLKVTEEGKSSLEEAQKEKIVIPGLSDKDMQKIRENERLGFDFWDVDQKQSGKRDK